jgi:hypothetical protein
VIDGRRAIAGRHSPVAARQGASGDRIHYAGAVRRST